MDKTSLYHFFSQFSYAQRTAKKNNLIIPFSRNGDVYVFHQGQEQLIEKAPEKSSGPKRHDIVSPLLSPNHEYIAYIALNDASEHEYVPKGKLKIYYTQTGKIRDTGIVMSGFIWTSSNEIAYPNYVLSTENRTILNPQSLQKTQPPFLVSYEYPSPNHNNLKEIIIKNKNVFLKDTTTQKETFIFTVGDIYGASPGWSPNGRYALFDTFEKDSGTHFKSLDTFSAKPQLQEVSVLSFGGAGGGRPAGTQWYFNQGFVVDCSPLLYFVNGSVPLSLTHEGGGGCSNSEGYVATSPDGKYAFIKMLDHFELHTLEGEKIRVNGGKDITIGRGRPGVFRWYNDKIMLLYENESGLMYEQSVPSRIFLYDREKNTLYPLISNASFYSSL